MFSFHFLFIHLKLLLYNCHIIISKAVKWLYNNRLTIQAQQIRNKNPYKYVNIMKGNASEYKRELLLVKPLLL